MGGIGIDASSALNTVVGTGMGLLLNGYENRNQLDQQGKLQQQQMEGQKEMTKYNEGVQMDLWNKTNYPAQVEQMNKAGLNPGLLYHGTGGGGATTNIAAGNVATTQPHAASASIGMGMQMASQMALINAQTENVKADTANKLAQQNVNVANVPKINAETSNVSANTQLTESNTAMNVFKTETARIESELAVANKSNNIGMLGQAYQKLVADTQLTETQTDEARAKIINLAVQDALMQSDVSKNKSDISLNASKISEISNNISLAWKQLVVNQGNADTNADQARTAAGKLFQEQVNSGWEQDTWTGDKLTQIGSMIFGALMLKGTPRRR